MLRITTTTDKGSTLLKLEGRLVGPWVDELEQAWKAALARGGKEIRIDLHGVSYADRRGADLLAHMEFEGGRLKNCSDFIRQLLQTRADRSTSRRTTKRAKKENEHASTVQS